MIEFSNVINLWFEVYLTNFVAFSIIKKYKIKQVKYLFPVQKNEKIITFHYETYFC